MKLYKNQKGFGGIEALIIVVIIGLIGGVGYYVYNRQTSKNEEPQTAAIVKEENPKTITKESLPELVDYGEDGISVTKKSDAKKLYDTSESFKAFIASRVPEKEAPLDPTKCNESQGFYVRKVYKDKFAIGNACADNIAGFIIWAKEDDQWGKLIVSSEQLSCEFINKHNIPAKLDSNLEACYVEKSDGDLVKKNLN